MDLKNLPSISIVDDDNKEGDDRLIADKKSQSESEPEPEPLLPTVAVKREKLDLSIHQHALFSCEEDNKNETSCCVCGNFVCAADETTSTYCCSPCSFYIHKSCIPVEEIAHEFHPHHPLTLYWKKVGACCDACLIEINGFTYHCVECDFDICLECTSKVPSIRDQRHDHLLTFFNKMYMNQKCIMDCGLSSPDAAFLRCVQCNFNVHLICSPLPRGIKFKGHLHSLALEDYHIEDDFGEYYCDHCEGPRDPKECAYHCTTEGCPYIAEFNCVVDEVVRSLNENHAEDGFCRTVNRLAANEYYYRVVTKGLCLHDVYQSSPEEELELEVLKRITEKAWEATIVSDNLQFGYLIFNSDAIEHVRGKCTHFFLSTMDLKSQIVEIGNYIITKDLETMFSEIHRKYSDIGEQCSLSKGLKTIALIQFVQLIHDMIKTRISNITQEIYLLWLFRLLFALYAGFKVEFVYQHMKKVLLACFGMNTLLDNFPEVKDYYKEIKVINEEIQVRKAKLVRLNKKEKESIELLLSRGLKEERHSLLDQLDFTLGTAGKGLL